MLGFIGGVEVGYNVQFDPLVLGVETDFSYANINGSASASKTFLGGGLFLCPVQDSCGQVASYNEQQTLDWLATVRGRVGFTVTPSWLIFGTGGWAGGEVKTSALVNLQHLESFGGVTTGGAPEIFPASSSQFKNGWIIGGGTEYMLTKNWTAKVEHLYCDLGSVTLTETNPNPSFVYSSLLAMSNTPVRGQIFRVGANYKF